MALGIAGLLTASSVSAAPITITFDPGDPIGGLPVGTMLANQYAGVGVTFTPNAFTGTAGAPTGIWATNTDMTIVSIAGSNQLRSGTGWINEDGDASFRATFAGAGVSSVSALFGGILPSEAGSTRLFAYNGSTLLVVSMASGSDDEQVLTVSSMVPITSVVFTPGDFFDYVTVDNITFTPIPEPATLTLLALGIAAAARSRRRR